MDALVEQIVGNPGDAANLLGDKDDATKRLILNNPRVFRALINNDAWHDTFSAYVTHVSLFLFAEGEENPNEHNPLLYAIQRHNEGAITSLMHRVNVIKAPLNAAAKYYDNALGEILQNGPF